MKKGLIVGGGLLAALALLTWWFVAEPSVRTSGLKSGSDEDGGVSVETDPAGTDEQTPIRTEPFREEAAPSPGPARTAARLLPEGTLRIVLIEAATDAAVVDHGGLVRPARVQGRSAEDRPFRTDRAGVAELMGLPAGEYLVFPDADGVHGVSLREGLGAEIVIRLPSGSVVEGIVVDESGTPVRGASVWISDHGYITNVGVAVTTTDVGGGFRVKVPPFPKRFLWATHEELGPSRAHRAEPKMRLVIGPRGAAVAGFVHDRDQRPVPGAFLTLGWPMAQAGSEAMLIPARTVVVREDGRFTMRGLPPGDCPVIARKPGFRQSQLTLTLEAGLTAECDVTLEACARVEGIVRNEHGMPVDGISVVRRQLPFASTLTGKGGRYLLDELNPGPAELLAGDNVRGQGQATTILTLEAGIVSRWDPVLAPLECIEGFVAGPGPDELRRLRVRATDVDGAAQFSTVKSDGAFVVKNCRPAEHTLEVLSARGHPIAGSRTTPVWPGQSGIVLRIQPEDLVAREVRGRLVDGNQRGLEEIPLRIDPAGAKEHDYAVPQSSTTSKGTFTIKDLPGGRYVLSARSWAHGNPMFRGFDLSPADGGSKDLGEIVLHPAGSVVLRLADAEAIQGGPHYVLVRESRSDGPAFERRLTFQPTRTAAPFNLPPARHEIVPPPALGSGARPIPFTVRTGEAIELSVPAGFSRAWN